MVRRFAGKPTKKMPKKVRRGKQGWLERQTKLNIPRDGPFAYGNLLTKSQYCDFVMSALIIPTASSG